MRLIDADALFQAMEEVGWYNNADRDEIAETLILNAPTIESERRNGKWVEETDRKYHWHCSECGYVIGLMKMDSNYCPNCGCVMEGEQNDE